MRRTRSFTGVTMEINSICRLPFLEYQRNGLMAVLWLVTPLQPISGLHRTYLTFLTQLHSMYRTDARPMHAERKRGGVSHRTRWPCKILLYGLQHP
jgi:hypothetical protein